MEGVWLAGWLGSWAGDLDEQRRPWHRGLVVACFLRKGWGGLVGHAAVNCACLAENDGFLLVSLLGDGFAVLPLFAEKTLRRLARVFAKLFSFNII